jgi:hypothetical protein
MAIDVVYTFAAILKEPLYSFKSDLLEILNMVRTDKVKPVREAVIEAISMVKEVGEGSIP